MSRSFSPADGNTVNINVAATSARVLVGKRNSPMNVRIVNGGSAIAWIKAGGSTVTATTTADIPIGPGVHEVLTFWPDQNGNLYIAAIAAGSTGYIYFTVGEGI